jgi:transcriptional regulator with XRE-family HTH domain
VESGVSQERLAFDSGVDRAYLGGIERQVENPTIDLLDRLATTLGVPLADFFREPTRQQPSSGLKRGRRSVS